MVSLVVVCSKGPRYCSRECQVQHWTASHAVECRAIQAKKKQEVVLEKPRDGLADLNFYTVSHGGRGASGGGAYRIPQGVGVKEKFTVKVQAGGSRTAGSMLIYNEARDCSFFMGPAQAGYKELFDVVKAEKATNGTKTYMKAYFDEEGRCVAFPGDTSIHTW
jgi:MYND finger